MQAMITNSKIIEVFCTIGEFSESFEVEFEKNLLKGLPKSVGRPPIKVEI